MQPGFGLGLRGWNGKIQRSQRALSRRWDVVQGRAGSTPTPVGAFWWDVQSNFGDQLNVDILHHLGFAPQWSPAPTAELIPIGSLLEHLPADFAGAIWGSGMIDDHMMELPRAQILALRGRLTWENLRRPPTPALGDPGLLACSCYGPVSSIEAPLAIVPHLSHRQSGSVRHLQARFGGRVTIVDVTRPPAEVVRSIASSGAVISTSLHGLIVADSYGIPAAWWQPDPPLGGGTFKFRDYESVVSPTTRRCHIDMDDSLDDLINKCRRAHPDTVTMAIQELRSVLLNFRATRRQRSRVSAALHHP